MPAASYSRTSDGTTASSQLRSVPVAFLPEPWRMPTDVQVECGCVIGRDYPAPIVDHALARREALERYAAAR